MTWNEAAWGDLDASECAVRPQPTDRAPQKLPSPPLMELEDPATEEASPPHQTLTPFLPLGR